MALVTGASRGIGKTIARRLAHEGAVVAVHYGSNSEAASETVRSIREAGGQAFAVKGRLDTPGSGIGDEVRGMFSSFDEQAKEYVGDARLDILVNNAGVDRLSAIEQVTPETFDLIFSTNVRGPFFLTQQAIGRIRDNGRIIFISSGLAKATVSTHTIYSMTKRSMDKFMEILSQELGPRGITVNCVAPGMIETDMTAPWLVGNEAHARRVREATALRRLGTTKDIADIVAFLASDEGGWVTGNWIDATGGQR
jgi:NAD(P)-dependent dehydrogenase (short-subunit alcohol dehydrogenase family)